MGFRKEFGLVLGLATVLLMPTAMAKDFVMQIPFPDNAPAITAQQDYYLYVNGDWIKKTPIPSDEGTVNSFSMLENSTREQLMAITKDAVQHRAAGVANQDEAHAADFYACIVDKKGREAAGLGILSKALQRIEQAESIQSYADTMSALCRSNGMVGGMLGGYTVVVDPQEADRYAVTLKGPADGLGHEFMMDPANERYFQYYRDYMRDLLVCYGRSPESAAKSAAAIFALEKDIAEHSMITADRNDPLKNVHKMELNELKKIYSHIDIEKMLNAGAVGPANGVSKWYMVDIGAIERMNELCTPERLQILKDEAIVAQLSTYGQYLSKNYTQVYYDYKKKNSGAMAEPSEECKVEALNEKILPYTYGRLYGGRYFNEQKKMLMKSYLDSILTEYKQRLGKVDWLTESTRKKAIFKLDHMTINIGVPEECPAYLEKISVQRPENGGCLIDNLLVMKKLIADNDHQSIGQPVSSKIWIEAMPQDVNAFYTPTNNSINFPVAILKPPFFDPMADRETNLGGIGFVIAHEITHAFDNTGGQYDEIGRLRNWWMPEDYAKFKKQQAKIIAYYNQYMLPDGRRVNGLQTLGENIADLGAAACLTSIVGHDSEKLRCMYTNTARIWQEKSREAYVWNRMANNEHPLNYVRVDAVLSSTNGFYEAYDVHPGDGMYVAPENRVSLW